MTTNSQTPRTDALYETMDLPTQNIAQSHSETLAAVNLARTLERDNARLREALRGIVERLNFELQS